MIIVMERTATQKQLEKILERIEKFGLEPMLLLEWPGQLLVL